MISQRKIFFALFALAKAAGSLAATASDIALGPEKEQASFHLADPELRIEPVAAEPEVASPVALAWDEKGRLFVAEMLDYPSASTGGRIKMLEDRDGDGRYERATVFADKLDFPNGVLPWNGGLLVTAAPDILFLKDTDGDGRADERRVLLTGFGKGNQQLRVNGLLWGLDNWIYGANGRSDGDVRWVGWVGEEKSTAQARPAENKTFSMRGHDFRFRPDTGQFEVIAGRSQFGSARDDWGNRFLSWNTIPIRHEVLPERCLTRNPHLAATESVADILAPGDDGRVFPLTPPPLTFNNESVSHFNALAGLTLYRGEALGEKYRGNAFVGESLRNLVHRRVLVPNGPTFIAQRGEQNEFLASSDPWFHPVNFATGPDGALYVSDFYRQFVEHPDFVPQKLRGQVGWRTGAEHGRIWRIRHSRIDLHAAKPALDSASPAQLVDLLHHPNGWWRDTAQRLLVERRPRSAVPLLESKVRNVRSSTGVSRLHALYTLDGLGALTPELVMRALKDPQAGIREHALRLSEPFLSDKKLQRALPGLARDADQRVRFQLALTLGDWQSQKNLETLSALALKDSTNRWHALAILSSVGARPWLFCKDLISANERWLTQLGNEEAHFVDRLAMLIGASQNENDLTECWAWVTKPDRHLANRDRLIFLAGFGEGLSHGNKSLRQFVQRTEPSQAASLSNIIQTAVATMSDTHAPLHVRLAAIRVLAKLEPAAGEEVLRGLLFAEHSAEIQSAAVKALVDWNDAGVASRLFANWSRYSRPARQRILSAAPRSPAVVAALVKGLEQGNIRAVELPATLRQVLQKVQNAELKRRVERTLNVATTEREEVVRRFEPALKLEGDRKTGAEIFARNCLNCHALQGRGQRVGADLSGLASRPKEALLVDVLDPSRQVSPDFVSYTVVTSQGEMLPGLIVAETGNSLTLRRAAMPDETVLKNQIIELRAEGRSLMPDGLEQGLTQQDMADLLEFLRQPDAGLLPEEK